MGWGAGIQTMEESGEGSDWSWSVLRMPGRLCQLPWTDIRINTYLRLETKPAASQTKGNADDEPNQHEGNHRHERNSATRPLSPDKEVQQEEEGEHKARDEQRSHDYIALPCLAAEGLVSTGRHISTNETE